MLPRLRGEIECLSFVHVELNLLGSLYRQELFNKLLLALHAKKHSTSAAAAVHREMRAQLLMPEVWADGE